MVGAMAKIAKPTTKDDLVVRARRDADALGRLYDAYYDSIYRFCLCRVSNKETAEDITSTVFLAVARGISGFQGRTESDFRNWLYHIAANHANSYIRKTTRRKELLTEAARLMRIKRATVTDDPPELDWPMLCAAILTLKPKHQTIIILRFFENMEFEEIAKIVKARPVAVRVALHRALKRLRGYLETTLSGGA
jgi:RNA polymerase sigma-70 factor (ECF subfamily)